MLYILDANGEFGTVTEAVRALALIEQSIPKGTAYLSLARSLAEGVPVKPASPVQHVALIKRTYGLSALRTSKTILTTREATEAPHKAYARV